MARRSPKPRDSKDRILAAALALFGERGYAVASIDDIAARAGLTKGALYYYFSDKADIARDLHHAIWARIRAEALRGVAPGGDALANLRGAFDAHLAALQDLPEAHFFLRQFWAVPALDAMGRLEHEAALGFVEALLREGIARGDVAPLDPSALARVLVGAFSEATLHVLRTGESAGAVAVVHRVIDALAARHDRARRAQRPSRDARGRRAGTDRAGAARSKGRRRP
jgi:AcrR family transcriptional regulator